MTEGFFCKHTLTAGCLISFQVVRDEENIHAVLNLFPGDRIGAPAPDDRQIIAEFNKGSLVVLDVGRGSHQQMMISQLIPFPCQMD